LNRGPLSTSGSQWTKELMTKVFDRYASNGFVLGTIPGQPGYNDFQNFLYQLGCSVPVVYQDSLKDYCSIYTADRLSLNPEANNFCGCYLPDVEYIKYVDNYQIDKECTPMCNRPNSIPLVQGDNSAILCEQSVCLIDNIAINLLNSTVSGGININQMCGNCAQSAGSTAGCSCIIQNNTIDGVSAEIGEIDLSQSCSTTQCTITNPNPNGSPPTLDVPCGQPTDSATAFAQAAQEMLEQQERQRRDRNILLILLVGGGLLVLALLTYFLVPGKKAPEYTVRKVKDTTGVISKSKISGETGASKTSTPSTPSKINK
jgi:hypothetical protein